MKINVSRQIVKKTKPAPKKSAAKRSTAAREVIDWNETRLLDLSNAYLTGVMENLGSDDAATVCFSAQGKGVRPSYQVYRPDSSVVAFSGSSHKPLKKKLPETPQNISQPFSRSILASALEKKSP